MRRFLPIILFVFFSCSSEPDVPIVGTWRCEKVERVNRPNNQSVASSFGQEMAVSEKVSDTLILKLDNTYDEYISSLGIGNHIEGTYLFSQHESTLQLTKNSDAPGIVRKNEFSIINLTTDSLVLTDNEGFKFLYLRLETR